MVRTSNAVVAAVNGVFFVLGIALIGVGIHFFVHPAATICQRALQNPLIILGVVTSVVSVLGIVGSIFKNNLFLNTYLILLVVFVLGLTVVTAFLFLNTNRGHDPNYVRDYSHWLQNNFVKGKNWEIFKGCMADAKVCMALSTNVRTKRNAHAFVKEKFSLIQAGCCRPPVECGFQSKNSTFWVVPKSGPASNDTDCTVWSNNPKELCYNCNSCKEGSLANAWKQWRTFAIFSLSLLIFVTFFFAFGCYASKNNRYAKIIRPNSV